MLIRFTIRNVYSFYEQREFNMLPYNRLGTLEHHKYKENDSDIEFLKMASIYGANGSGKSNFVKALSLLRVMVAGENTFETMTETIFKLQKEPNDEQLFAIEFIKDDIYFYYAVTLNGGLVKTEELYEIKPGNEENLLFERSGSNSLKFAPVFEEDEKNQMLKSLLIEEFIKPEFLALPFFARRDNPYFGLIKKAFDWFDTNLQIITPDSKPDKLPYLVYQNDELKEYIQKIVCALDLGIASLKIERKLISDFFGDGTEKSDKMVSNIKKMMESKSTDRYELVNPFGDRIVIVKEDDEYWVIQLKTTHNSSEGKTVDFSLNEESDGTVRLLDFGPLFHDLINSNEVYVVDEIERSIHPLLIKELLTKFSHDECTKGQLIFTTHESNLLDQSIFRQDEIWFTEKNKKGATDIYSLSDFKIHKTIDIQKGYFAGRYGAVPFLGNLKELKWNSEC